MHEITELLQAWNRGEEKALDKLVPLVDQELKNIAHGYLRREREGHILQTTALVNEALIKLIKENVSWENRRQFYAIVARRMRHVLIDYAHKEPRGGKTELTDELSANEKSKELRMLGEALTKLAGMNKRLATVVECHHFIGLTLSDTAKVLGVSQATVDRDWRFARSWLKNEISGDQ